MWFIPEIQKLFFLSQFKKWLFINTSLWDFPCGPVFNNLPSNAVDLGLIPSQGTKIPRAEGQLSVHATTIEPRTHWSPRTTPREDNGL